MPTPLPAAPCPICERPARSSYAPFCSSGCRDRDLLQWLGEGYRLPGRAIDPIDDHGLDSTKGAD